MASTRDIELQTDTLGQGRGQPSTIKNDDNEAAGYGDSSTKIWKLYGTESGRHDKELVDSWKSNTESMLIFTGLFSSIVASFLIETYKTLIPAAGSTSQTATPSAIRINILLFLSLFFSVTSALVSTLIQQWAREYLQYSQPSAPPHKRGRVRAYLFAGLSRFQMRRLTYGVPVLLHLAVFLFFYGLSEWLRSINVTVGNTARYCLIGLLAVYMALSVLPLIVRNAPYQTALTTPLQACVSLIQVSYIVLHRLVRRSSTIYQAHKRSGLFKSIHIDRARALMREIQKKASELDRSAMHWLLQELDEDDMDTFLSGLPGYLHSPLLKDKKLVVEGLMEDGVPGRIREHITTCLRSVELSQEGSMSRASACINSLRLISEAASETAITRPGSEGDDIQEIMEYLEPLCYNSPTALRASCIRGLVIREFLIPIVDSDARNLQTKFPAYLIPLHKVISVWKTTEIVQWSQITGILTATTHPLPSDSEQVQQDMWVDVYDGPLINLAVLAYAVLSRVDEGDVNLDMAWKTLETLLKSLGLDQVRASPLARARFEEVLQMARDGVGRYDGGVTQMSPLLKMLDIVTRGLRLAEAFAYRAKPMLPRKQIEAIFGPEQLRNTELLEAFAAHLPGYVVARAPEASQKFMERLILEDKLWEQIHANLIKVFDRRVPFSDKLRIFKAFFDVFDVAFDVLKESTIIDWRSTDLDLLFGHLVEFEMKVAPGESLDKVVNLRSILFRGQFCHVLLTAFSMRRNRGEPLMMEFSNSLSRLVGLLGVGTQEDMDSLIPGNPGAARTGFDMMIKADAILSVTLRDGPLSNFCILGRLVFDLMASDASGLPSDDIQKLWKALDRMLHTSPTPFADSSEAAWTRFDHLHTLVRDPALLGGNSQTMERLRPLLDMIEEVKRIRPPADGRTEGTGNVDNPDDPADPNTPHPAGPPIPGSSGRVEASRRETGGPMDRRVFPPAPGPTPFAGMNQRAHGWKPPYQPNVDPSMANESPTSFFPPTQPGPGAEFQPPFAYPPRAPQVSPSNSPTPFMPSMGGPRRSGSLGPPNIQGQGYMQPIPSDFPFPPGHMIPHHYPVSSQQFRPGPEGPPPGHFVQDSPVDVDWTGGDPTPDVKATGGEKPSSE